MDLADAAPEHVKPLISAENTCVLLNKSDLGRSNTPETVTFAGKPLPFWVVSLTEETGTKTFLGELQRYLRVRCVHQAASMKLWLTYVSGINWKLLLLRYHL